MIRSKIILPATLGLTLFGGILFATGAGAQTPSSGTQTIIQKIAQRFNLNEAEVKQVFEEQKTAHQAERKQNLENKLAQAVTDGKITEAQKTAILEKFTSMKASMPDKQKLREMTQEQRKAQMDAKKQELEQWATQNNLSLETLKELMGHKNR